MKLRWSNIVPHVILSVFSLCILLPLIWVLRVSLTDKLTAYKIPPEIGHLGLENYVEIFSTYPFERWFLNSLVVALAATAISLPLATAMAYAFARFNTGGAFLRLGVLASQMLPPIILVLLRLLQGLALGGEYGGAATYVAEHAPAGKRGLHTSWIQTTATLGLFLSLLVILGCRYFMGEEVFGDWGWRVPFLISLLLLLISVWIRLKLSESPTFQKMKDEGKGSKAPLTESFGQWSNLKIVLLALFGLTAGQAVVWYTGQFYALFFLTQSLKVDAFTANLLIAASLAIGTPCFILFGWLSDKIGRKRIIMAGCALAVLTYFPVFKGITHFANPALEAAQASAPVTVVTDPDSCSFQFNPVGTSKFLTSCDIAKSFLAKGSVNYSSEDAAPGTVAQVKVGDTVIESFEGTGLPAEEMKAKTDAFTAAMTAAVAAAGYPAKADPAQINYVMTGLLLVYLVVLVTMVYGPIAAMLVELFPTRIRYTSMSLPYHIGNGWFGGFLPTVSFAMVAASGDIYYGLWYPIAIAAMTLVVGVLFIHETKDHRMEVW